MSKAIFQKTLIIGVGLIGSSLARGLKNKNISDFIFGFDIDKIVQSKCNKLKIVDKIINNFDKLDDFNLIILCSPLGSYKEILSEIVPYIKKECIITDVGSTKLSVVKEFNKYVNNKLIEFVPGHPIAGLEKSGPEYGFEDLFKNRYCILTPENQESPGVRKISKMWEKLGMKIEFMNPVHHDRVLAMTSHIPQLIAYSIVATATELEEKVKEEIIKYSASGFRDFTRLAGSDPIMWRDVYLLNKEPVLEMLGRFSEDLSSLQKAIRNNDKNFLEKVFKATKDIRNEIEKAGQAGTFDPREKNKL
ncbi:MAG: Prephenate dehydrogenase [Alphaproteobacteria bacterium MarineAlpha5_Bin11]|nr:MAG: Prephenate dehydrogenase [Alphaproteobacteria bacterium MarineAlpha5_Bin11]PPR51403.1 MAG: Prephenate dehydrogenase [Alphaproteobacteria bacterium MarineAlpha5_Bin10]|tara:strand:- start:573 stop:1487 length:915 start_codon:yes stop_codon:yes gene_type:complete